MKKLLLVFILIFSLSFFCGCQKEELEISSDFILLSLDLSGDKVTESVRIGVNSKKISELSSSLKEELEFRKNLIKEVEKLRLEFLFSLALVYSTNPIEEFKLNQGAIISQTAFNERGDFVGFDVSFSSLKAWQYYHKGGESVSVKNQGNIFYSKKQSDGSFPFSAISDGKTLGQNYKNYYLNAAQNLSFSSQIAKDYHPEFVYNYSTIYKQIKSDAQGYYLGVDGKYHHVWVVKEENLNKNNTISLYFTEIYKGWWIFFGTFIPLAGCTIAILTIKLKKKKIKN